MQPELIGESESGIMAAARELAERLHLPTTLVKFLIVGGIGFVINQFFLFLFYDSPVFWFFPDKHADVNWSVHKRRRAATDLVDPGGRVRNCVPVQRARAMDVPEPAASGWIGKRFVKFNVSSAISPIIVVVATNALTPVLDGTFGALSPYIANGIGVLLGFSWNWGLNSLVIWPRQREAAEEG
jgi:putative flippase GtrA